MDKHKEIIVALIAAVGVVGAAWVTAHKEEPKPQTPQTEIKQGDNSSINGSFNSSKTTYENNFTDINNSKIDVNQGNVYNGAKAK